MPELSPVTQAWLQVVLVWIGFGSLAGLLARVLLPFREPSSPLAPLTLGITGSAVGLGAISWLQNGGPPNPVSPIGFLAATGGAVALLLAYHLLRLTVHHNRAAEINVKPPREGGLARIQQRRPENPSQPPFAADDEEQESLE